LSAKYQRKTVLDRDTWFEAHERMRVHIAMKWWQKRAFTYILAVIALATLGVLVSRLSTVDRVAADKLAARELERYALRERRALVHFSEAEVTEENGKWLYSYQYKGEPNEIVAIIVHRGGRTELSRMRDAANP
jgi:hypothetical protein